MHLWQQLLQQVSRHEICGDHGHRQAYVNRQTYSHSVSSLLGLSSSMTLVTPPSCAASPLLAGPNIITAVAMGYHHLPGMTITRQVCLNKHTVIMLAAYAVKAFHDSGNGPHSCGRASVDNCNKRGLLTPARHRTKNKDM